MIDIEKLRLYRKLVIIAIFSDDELMDIFVLKGGSAIELVYKMDSRSSVDIDLSMENNFPEEDLPIIKEKLNNVLSRTFYEESLQIFDFKMLKRPKVAKTTDMETFWGGYLIEFKICPLSIGYVVKSDLGRARKIAEVVAPSGSKKLTVDISSHEICSSKIHKELDGYTIPVYTLEMIVVEKLRAICQQMKEYQMNNGKDRAPRPRDFYDIYVLMHYGNLNFGDDEKALLERVFAIKKVDISLLKLIPQYYEFTKQGERSLLDTMPANKRDGFNFKECFDFVVNLVKTLEMD